MCSLYVIANFFWAAVFFATAAGLAVVIARKLSGRSRVLVAGLAVSVAVGTGFCMMGQYWVDMVRLRHSADGDMVVDGRLLPEAMDLLARSFASESAPVIEWLGDADLVLDVVSIPSPSHPLSGPSQVLVVYLTDEHGDPRRLYVVCDRLASNEWIVTKAYGKELRDGKLAESPVWSLWRGPSSWPNPSDRADAATPSEGDASGDE